jgi:ANTAR domain
VTYELHLNGDVGLRVRTPRLENGKLPRDYRLDFRVESPADVERLIALASRLLERTLQLEEALRSRVTIEQAKGVLAERLGLEMQSSFELLRRASRTNRMRIHDLAAVVVSSRETPAEIAELVSGTS